MSPLVIISGLFIWLTDRGPIFYKQEREGLLRKNYIADIEKGFAGGVYTFSTIENAKEWFSEDRIKWITERYSKPEIEYYESPVIVDNEKNKIIS